MIEYTKNKVVQYANIYRNQWMNEMEAKCTEDPFFLENIRPEHQNAEIISTALDGCRNNPGVNPSEIREYVDDSLKGIVDNFRGHWAPAPPDNLLTWYE